MMVLSSLLGFISLASAYFGINTNGVPNVTPSTGSEIILSSGTLSNSLNPTYSSVPLDANNSSTARNIYYRSYNNNNNLEYDVYNLTNRFSYGGTYDNISILIDDYFCVSLDFSDRVNNHLYLYVQTFNQCNVYFDFTINQSAPSGSYYYLHHTFLEPIENNYRMYRYEIPFVSSSGQYLDNHWILSFGLESQFLTDLVNSTTDDYNTAYTNGYNVGYDNGYSTGNTEGYNSGYSDGSTSGYNSGYSTGLSEGINQTNTTFINLFGAVADTPVIMFYRLFNFDLFGTSVIVIILSLFTALILLGILRRFLKF